MKRNMLLFINLFAMLVWLSGPVALAQDRAVYKEKEAGFYQNVILKSFEIPAPEIVPGEKYLSAEIRDSGFLTDTGQYQKVWHTPPHSQGITGTCWSFAATSFMESEVYRTTGRRIKLSEMYFVYWEYVERAKYFVENRGEMYFGEGSEANAVTKLIGRYGAVPYDEYRGRPVKSEFHDHRKLFDELNNYLISVKQANAWNNLLVEGTVRSILNKHLGEPPSQFRFEGREMTPFEFTEEMLKIRPGEYFSFMSVGSVKYNQKGELKEPDNWWHCDDYYNLTLDDFLGLLSGSLEKGYSVAICGDVSEPGYDRFTKTGVIPSFDIPGDHINADAREYRIHSNITTDDHCIHGIGIAEKEGKKWVQVKDSGAGAFDGLPKGYRFIRDDYIRLKVLTILVHKDAARHILDKIIK